MKEGKNPSYLFEFPNEDFKKELKLVCTHEGVTIKDFIERSLTKEIIKSKEKLWMEDKI